MIKTKVVNKRSNSVIREDMHVNTALVLSGGIGTRMGTDIPKQYVRIGDKMMIMYCLETLAGHKDIDAIRIVADQGWQDVLLAEIKKYSNIEAKFVGFSEPGMNRQMSIVNGLRDMCATSLPNDLVMIHDAARPNLSAAMITDCFTAVVDHDGVLPTLPMKDTVYVSRDGNAITELLDRETIYAGQAPEVFVFGKYLEACERLCEIEDNGDEFFEDEEDREENIAYAVSPAIMKICGSSEPAVMAGMDIVMIPGYETNFKVTTPTDLERFKAIIEARNAGN